MALNLKTNEELEHWLSEERAGKCRIVSLGTNSGRGVFTTITVLLLDDLGGSRTNPKACGVRATNSPRA